MAREDVVRPRRQQTVNCPVKREMSSQTSVSEEQQQQQQQQQQQNRAVISWVSIRLQKKPGNTAELEQRSWMFSAKFLLNARCGWHRVEAVSAKGSQKRKKKKTPGIEE